MAKVVAEYELRVKRALKELDKLQKEVKDVDGSLKKTGKEGQKAMNNVGKSTNNLSNSFKNLGGQILTAFGVVGTVQVFVSAIKNAVQVAANFERQMSKVRAITGATDKEIKQLESSAKKLGSSTRFTATQVAELQEEFAKLGFSTQEILAATEATLSLAAAAGTDLATAANVSGQVVRAFGLDAEETARVVDVMALSFSKSALNIYSFQESMKFAAPIARAAGIEVETVTALLSKLADAGLRGSIAGTGLKNLLSQLSDANSDLGKELGFSVKNSEDLFRALDQLKNANIDLTKATELTDERSKAAFITLINGADDVRTLTDAYRNATGAANEMAEQMEDNFRGATTRLASAWEGLMLQIAGSNGYLKVFVELMTDYVNLTQRVFASEDDLLQKDIESNAEAGRRNALTIEKLKLLKEVNGALGVNEQMMNAAYSDKVSKRIDFLNDKIKEQKDIIKDPMVLDKDLADAQVMLAKYEAELEVTRKTQEKLNKMMSGDGEGEGGGAIDTYVRSLNQLNSELKDLQKSFKDAEIGGADFYRLADEIDDKIKEIDAAMKLLIDRRFRNMPDVEIPIQTITEIDSQKLATDEIVDDYERRNELIRQKIEERNAFERNLANERAEQEKQIYISLAQEALSTVGNIANIVANSIQNTINNDIVQLQRLYEEGEISREEFERKQTELQRKSAQAAKDAALFNAIIGTSQAIINALSSPGIPFPVAAGFAALAAAQGAVQVAAIASEPLPQFAEGGLVAEHGLLKGKTHAQGGIPIEAERDEFFVNAKRTRENIGLLKAVNNGTVESFIMSKYVKPMIDETMFKGFADIGKSAELNDITATFKDHNIIHSVDRLRQSDAQGFKYLGSKIDKIAKRNTRAGW